MRGLPILGHAALSSLLPPLADVCRVGSCLILECSCEGTGGVWLASEFLSAMPLRCRLHTGQLAVRPCPWQVSIHCLRHLTCMGCRQAVRAMGELLLGSGPSWQMVHGSMSCSSSSAVPPRANRSPMTTACCRSSSNPAARSRANMCPLWPSSPWVEYGEILGIAGWSALALRTSALGVRSPCPRSHLDRRAKGEGVMSNVVRTSAKTCS